MVTKANPTPEEKILSNSTWKGLEDTQAICTLDGYPVYNVEIEPKISRKSLILAPDREILAKFFIGHQSNESLTPGLKPGELIEILAEGKPLDLTVTLFCNLSDTDTYQQRRISYDPKKKQSDSAEFKFVPRPAAVRDSDGNEECS